MSGWWRRLSRVLGIGLVLSLPAAMFAPGAPAEGDAVALSEVTVESRSYEEALARLEQARRTIAESEARIELETRTIAEMESALTQIRRAIPTLRARISEAEELVGTAREGIADVAVASYVFGGSAGTTAVTGGEDPASAAARNARRRFVLRTLEAGTRAQLDSTIAIGRTAREQLAEAADAVVALGARREESRRALSAAREALEAARSALARLEESVSEERRLARVTGTDLSYIALEAYVRAADRINAERPSCRLPWSLLAGIGRVESRHGTYGGTRLLIDGTVSAPIIGIALSGQRETAVIVDSDGGSLDGDTEFDRAVGPMQFIPSTWARNGRDANGDGVRDPQNIYDAALSAADYLCQTAYGLPLDTPEGQQRAVFAYNQSEIYVATVLAYARDYSRLRVGP